MRGFAPTAPTPALPVDVRLLQSTAQAVLLMAAVALLAAASVWALRLPVFALREIRLEGEISRNSESTIRANAAPKLAGNFITMDLRQARAAFESVPWVRRAVVRRVWPMRLVVQLEEHRPVALWGPEETSERMVNHLGEVFEANVSEVEDDGLPRLEGPDGSAPQMLAMVHRLAQALAPLKAGEVEELTLSARGSWRVLLDKGATLELGRGSDDEVIARTEHFVRTMPRVEAIYQRPLLSADLRHNGGFAVRLQGITTVQPTSSAAPKKR